MNLSLNELSSLIKTASKGAGYSWGIAEEAAFAAKWLAQQGHDAASSAERLFSKNCVKPCAGCPLHLGARLIDTAHSFPDEGRVLKDVSQPILLLPFVAQLASLLDTNFAVQIDDVTVYVSQHGLELPDALPDHSAICVVQKTHQDVRQIDLAARAMTDATTVETLRQFAAKTHAPATEASRLLGAGSGLSDND